MKTYLEPKDVQLMERAATCLRDRLLIQLLFRLGCRVSELLAIKVSDINFTDGKITVLHLKTRIQLLCPGCKARLARRHQFCPGCGAGVKDISRRAYEHRRIRVLPVDKCTLDMLREYITPNGVIHAEDPTRVFNLNRHRAWQIVRNCAKRARLPDLVNPETGRVRGVSPHRLRDAFSVHAMKMDDSGDALRLLQEHLGHASFNTTAKYRKVADEEHRRWYDRLWNSTNNDE